MVVINGFEGEKEIPKRMNVTTDGHDELIMDLAREMARVIIDRVSVGIILVKETGVIVFCNQSAEGLFGYTNDEIIGNDFRVLLQHPNQEYINLGFENIIAVSNMDHNKATTFNLEARHKNGTSIPIEINFNEIRVIKRRLYVGTISLCYGSVHHDKKTELFPH